MGCCNNSTSLTYTVRRYDADGNTLWIRDFFRDANWGAIVAASDDSVEMAMRLSVAATPNAVFVGGPLVGHQFGGVVASKWNLVCYQSSSGGRLFRRNVWDDMAPLGATPVVPTSGRPRQFNVVDVCFGLNGQIGVLMASADKIAAIDEPPTTQQMIALYAPDGAPTSYMMIHPVQNTWFTRIKIDLAGSIHLSGLIGIVDQTPDFQRVIAIPLRSGELIGCAWVDRSVLFPNLALRSESSPGVVAWATHIADILTAEEVTDLALASNGDILAAGSGFHLSGTAGVWGRFASSGTPEFVGVDTGSISSGRIAAGTDQYYLSATYPSLLCRSDADNSHRWAHRHQQIEGLAAASSGVVTVGLQTTINKSEQNFIPESDFDH